MSKVSSKYQVTLPRALARAHQIVPGEEVIFEEAGSALYLRREQKGSGAVRVDCLERLKRFDLASARQESRNQTWTPTVAPVSDRGGTREELYQR